MNLLRGSGRLLWCSMYMRTFPLLEAAAIPLATIP